MILDSVIFFRFTLPFLTLMKEWLYYKPVSSLRLEVSSKLIHGLNRKHSTYNILCGKVFYLMFIVVKERFTLTP